MNASARSRLGSAYSRRWMWLGSAAIGLLAVAGSYLAVLAVPRVLIDRTCKALGVRVDCGHITARPWFRLVIRDLVLRPISGGPGPARPLLRAALVKARLRGLGLLGIGPAIEDLEVEDFYVRLVHDWQAGQWNIKGLGLRLLPDPRGLPEITLRRGRLAFLQAGADGLDLVHQFSLDGRLRAGPSARGYQCDLTAGTDQQRMTLLGTWEPGRLEVAGRLGQVGSGPQPPGPSVSMGLELDYAKGTGYRLDLWAKGLPCSRITDAFVLSLARPLFIGQADPIERMARVFDRFQPSGVVDVQVTVAGGPSDTASSAYAGTVLCRGLTICDRRFPYRVDGLEGQIEFGPDGIRGRRLLGRHGQAEILIDFWTRGAAAQQAYDVTVSAADMVLDDELYGAIQPNLQRVWTDLEPAGRVCIRYTVSKHPADAERYSLLIQPQGIRVCYKGFPYPLHNLYGQVLFEPDRVTFSDLVAQGSRDAVVRIEGTGGGLESDRQPLDLVVHGENVPLDQDLGRALPAQAARAYGKLSLTGLLDATVRYKADGSAEPETSVVADMAIKNASATVLEGKVHLQALNGLAELTGDSLVFKDLSCNWGPGRLTISGVVPWRSADAIGSNWTVRGVGVGLGDLGRALPQRLGRYVSDLGAAGPVDMSARFTVAGPNDLRDYRLTVRCMGDQFRPAGCAHPVCDVSGQITLEEGSVVIRQLRFSLPDVNGLPAGQITLDGTVDIDPEAGIDGTLGLLAKDLSMGPGTMCIMPGDWAARLGEISLAGRATEVTGIVNLKGRDLGQLQVNVHTILTADALRLQLGPARMAVSGRIEATVGYARASGIERGNVALTEGQVTVNGRTAQQVGAVFEYDPVARAWRTDGVCGRIAGGWLYGRASLGMDQIRPRLEIDLGIVGSRFAGIAYPDTGPDESLEGKGLVDAWLGLSGQLTDVVGQCRIQVRDLQVGKASILSRILDMLRLREAADYMFEQMELESYIRQNKVFIEHFAMAGRSASFQGSGQFDLATEQLNVTLLARTGSRLATAEPTALQSLAEGLGGGMVRMEIRGRLSDPQISTKTLPLLEEPLRILGTVQ